MANEKDRFLLYLLKSCKGIGNVSLLRLCSEMMENENDTYSLKELINIMQVKKQYLDDFTESYLQIENNKEQLLGNFQKTKMTTLLDNDYPDSLRHIYNPPVSLFYEGNLELLHRKSLAVIGTRLPTSYANHVIEKLTPSLIENNLVIVSGLARGVDTLVHREVIKNGGATIGVIGSGLDIVYPKENGHLQEIIAQDHLLLSEYADGSLPLPHHFPQRNRLISGITMGTCVVEAKKRSGTLITAQLALDSGKDVFAIPGNIFAENSEGCHLLIQQGAKCVWNAEQIIEEYKYY